MSLQSLQLDNLTWTQMVDAIRGRIAANSDGEWTMHAPVDPGVTLLELFAYLFEQRLYWMDQVPEPLDRALLALLDEAPLTTAIATTLLAFRSLGDSLPQQIDAGTVFYPRDKALLLPFTTLESAKVLPINYIADTQPRIDLIVSGSDRSADLRAGRLAPLLPADGSASELKIIFWLERGLAATEADGNFNIFFDLDTPAAIAPEWAPLPDDIQWFDRTTQAGYARRPLPANEIMNGSCILAKTQIESGTSDIFLTLSSEPSIWINDFISTEWNRRRQLAQAPAKLKWLYSTGAGTRKMFTSNQLYDATGGLRRSGLVRITVPEDWQPLTTPASGPIPYAVWITCEACTYSSPPRLRRIVPNAVISSQILTVHVDWSTIKPQLANWLRLPGQTLQLPPDKPEPLENAVYLKFREKDGHWNEWRPTDHFYHHGPEDRVFVIDRQRKRLIFGDGLRGRIPVLDVGGEPLAQLCYVAGGGSQGNVGKLIWVSQTTDLQPQNPVAAVGGAEAETLAEAKARAGSDLTRCERAITARDFELLARTTPGIAIARSYAAIGFHPGFPCHPVSGAITLFVVPQVPREAGIFESDEVILAPQTDPGALSEVARRIGTRRLLTAEVYVRSARYRAVHLLVELQGEFANHEEIQTLITLKLTEYLDPLIGGEQGKGWPFGAPLRPSNLIKQLQLHIADGIIIRRIAISLDSIFAFEDCHDVTIGAHELVYLQSLSFSVDRTPVSLGGLR